MTQLDLHVDPAAMPLFTPLLEKGVVISARIGCTLRDFVCSQLGFAEDYLDRRIQTLFLDARPVDDVDKTIVSDGATLALSAAMPGLVGATMRKGGRYAGLRRDISQPDDACGICEKQGRVTVKLFNMVARVIGDRLLETGVDIDGSDLSHLVERYPEALVGNIRRAYQNGRAILPVAAFFSTLAGQRVQLRVTTVR